MLAPAAAFLAGTCGGTAAVHADVWRPSRHVEFITGGSGGSQERPVRLMQHLVQDNKLLPVPAIVTVKPGAGGALSIAYLNQHPGNAHYTVLVSPTFVTNHITGSSATGPADVTPLVNLYSEHLGFHVRADSPIRTGRDLVQRLLQDPQSLSIAIGSNAGNLNHMALVKLMRAANMSDANIRRLKTVSFKGSEHIAALLGGHIDVLVLTLSPMRPHVEAGQVRTIAHSSARRVPGPLAEVPTWKEQGYDIVMDAWRMMLGPRSLSAAQIAFWESLFAQIIEQPEWKKDLEGNLLVHDFRRSKEAAAYLNAEHAEMRSLLTALGMIKQ
jgi:putative tricarboxylic transport membrane protein